MKNDTFPILVLAVVWMTFCGCALSPNESHTEAEVWAGKVTGMADGDLKLFLVQTEEENNFSLQGNMEMHMEKTAGGYGSGRITGRIKGSIANGVLKAIVTGFATVTEGSSPIRGQMTGTISETEASGKWKISHSQGFHSGEWSAHKNM